MSSQLSRFVSLENATILLVLCVLGRGSLMRMEPPRLPYLSSEDPGRFHAPDELADFRRSASLSLCPSPGVLHCDVLTTLLYSGPVS